MTILYFKGIPIRFEYIEGQWMMALADIGRALRIRNIVQKSRQQITNRQRILAKVPVYGRGENFITFVTPRGVYTMARGTKSERGEQFLRWAERSFADVRRSNEARSFFVPEEGECK